MCIRDRILNGWTGTVETSSSTEQCTTTNYVGCYEGNPGAYGGSHKSALQTLQDSGDVFAVPVFAVGSGTGANFTMRMNALVQMKLTGFKVTGKQSSRYLDLEIVADGLVQQGDSLGELGLSLCGNDTIDKC